ncbi:Serine protease 65 [Operophtera brumata]|uniref:Serine protease 65 n=1 Tax=Operophtera brumata TaxID=104452 RepID=A0A0L7LIY5_OPEBR|nr:Serine protease 65 [Operophtera brumata]
MCLQVGMVVWMDFGQSVCGSTLLTDTRAITAAHCWYDGWRWARLLTMVFGSEYVFTGGVRVDTDQVDMHEDWTPSTLRNDVAIVSFPRIEFTDVIQPIALPSGRLLNNDFTGNLAFASGYGILSDSMGLSPNQVQSHVELEVISNDICRFRFGEFIFDSTICTSGVSVNGNVGICSSDSGGPLSTVEDGKRVLVFHTAFKKGLMLIPGQAFTYASAPCQHIRLTFSKIAYEDMNTAVRHLADIIRNEQRRALEKQPQRLATDR